MASPQPPKTIFTPYDVLESAEVLTTKDPSTLLPGHRKLVAGANVTLDDTVDGELAINASGGGGGTPITELTGDVVAVGPGSVPATIAPDAVTNAKLANMPDSTLKGRAVGAGAGDPTDLTPTQSTAILNPFVGDTGAGGLKGLVPGPAAGDAAAKKFLSADGTFKVLGAPSLHAPTHSAGGTDPVTVTALAGYPGGTVNFLRADGTFAPIPSGPPLAHAPTHSAGGSDPVSVLALAGYPGGTANFLRADGTFAPPTGDLSGYVPYVGATATVNLNTQALVAGLATFSNKLTVTSGGFDVRGYSYLRHGDGASQDVSLFMNNGFDGYGIRLLNFNGGVFRIWRPEDSFEMLNVGRAGNMGNAREFYPGLIAGHGGPGLNTSYYIAGSTSYGLYSNTGLYLAHALWTAAFVSVGTTLSVAGAATVGGTLFITSYFNTSSYIMSSGVIYPGRINDGAQQSSWYLASHPSYGLYSNTGFYIGGNLYVGAFGGIGLGWAAFKSGLTGTINGALIWNGTYSFLNFTDGVLTSVTPA